MYSSYIAGIGHFVPERVVTNFDLEKLMDTSDEWIYERTGIKERRWIVPCTETTTSMGIKAAKAALQDAGKSPDEIDFIVFATISPDYYFPGPGVGVQEALGISEIGALDVRNQCSGFIYALSVADQFIKTGMYKNILVIGAELQSHGLDKTTRGRNVSVIFGDGAGAVVLSAAKLNNSSQILSTHLHSQGSNAAELMVKDPGNLSKERFPIDFAEHEIPESYFPYMNGNLVFKHAVTRFQEVINEALSANNKSVSDLKLLVPHQANYRITQFVQRKFALSDAQVMSNIHRYGNTTAASIPIALSEAKQEGRIQRGDLVCLAAFGSGFTWASALIRW
ncbi:MAG: beta-ketoacyl-ACP synthase III [Chitinophagales bacterium]|nr:ketoacyl-ACP synthase III [Bacteroidota bacterium]MCB9043977.1 ketoacyl-ACP synthase III [Chitinophagales bacterium]